MYSRILINTGALVDVASALISNAMFGVESDRADAACAAASATSAERKARLI